MENALSPRDSIRIEFDGDNTAIDVVPMLIDGRLYQLTMKHDGFQQWQETVEVFRWEGNRWSSVHRRHWRAADLPPTERKANSMVYHAARSHFLEVLDNPMATLVKERL